jgi:hypothetical protein
LRDIPSHNPNDDGQSANNDNVVSPHVSLGYEPPAQWVFAPALTVAGFAAPTDATPGPSDDGRSLEQPCEIIFERIANFGHPTR